MKKVTTIIAIVICIFTGATVYATNEVAEVKQGTTGKIIEIKDKEIKTLQDYREAYGSDSYGLTAFLLNKVRIYSIPCGFVTIIIGAIYQYIIGLKKLDTRDKGFGLIIASVTLIVICQVLPLVFAIVVKGWRG